MTPERARRVFDEIRPGWRQAPLRHGERFVLCPLHDDHNPSLRIHEERGVWYCDPCGRGGGAWDLAVAAHGEEEARELLRRLTGGSGSASHPGPGATPQRVAEYLYTDRHGEPRARKVRWEPGFDGRSKSFSWEISEDAGGWIKAEHGEGNPRVLYGLPTVVEAEAVHLCEGEKAVDRLAHELPHGHAATCPPAGTLEPEMLERLRGKRITIWMDRDETGRRKATEWYRQVVGAAASVRIVQAAVEAPGADAFDQLESGFSIDEARPVDLTEAVQTNSVNSVTDPWDLPVDFGASEYGPPVPLEAFPRVVAEYVAELAEVVQAPLSFVAACALGALGAAGTGRAEVGVGCSNLVEPINLYLAPTAESGERKRVLRDLTFPLEDEERRLVEVAEPEVARLASERKLLEARAVYLRKQAARAKDEAERAKLSKELEQLELQMPEVPKLPRLLIDDATSEAVAKRLAEQKGRLSLISEEAGTLVEILLGKYRDGVADLDVFLKGYDGGAIRVDRASRDDAAIIERPSLAILVTPQPTVLERMAERTELRGRGMLARFLFVIAPSLVGRRTFRDRAVDGSLREAYSESLRAILRLDGVRLAIRGEALEVWRQYADAMEREQADGGTLSGLRDWASKHPGRVARIAALFHLAEHAGERPVPEAISMETTVAAWAVGQWLEGHALAAFARMGADPTVTSAKRILGWIFRHRPERFTLRDLHQHHRDVNRPQDLLPPLELLEGRGFLRRAPEPERKGPGRKPSPSFLVNPLTFRATSRDSQNTVPEAQTSGFVNSVTSPLGTI